MAAMPENVRCSVARLMGEYAYAVDDKTDPEAVVRLFAADAVIDFSAVGFPKMTGAAEIREFYTGLFGSMAAQFHHMANFRLAAWDGEVAVGEAYVIGMGHPREGADIRVEVKYRMECVETAAGWQCRRFSLAPMMPVGT